MSTADNFNKSGVTNICEQYEARLEALSEDNQRLQQERDEARLHYGQLQQMAEANGMELLSVTGDRLLLRNNRAITAESRATAAEALIERIADAVSALPSVTGLSPIKDVNDIPLAIRDLQECYRDAARSRNGQYTKLEARVGELREALLECVDASVTESDHCTVCLADANKHADGCAIGAARALLAGKDE